MQQPVLLAQRPVPVHQVEDVWTLRQQRGHALVELLAAHEEVAGAGLDGLRGQADVAALGDRDHRELGVLRADGREQRSRPLRAPSPSQIVEQHQVDRLARAWLATSCRAEPTTSTAVAVAGGRAQRADEVGERAVGRLEDGRCASACPTLA